MKDGHPHIDSNCHGVAVDAFMALAAPHRWKEIREFLPDDWNPPPIDIIRIDDSWIGLRTLDNMTDQEWQVMRETNWPFVKRYWKFHRNSKSKLRVRNIYGTRRAKKSPLQGFEGWIIPEGVDCP